MMIVVKVVLSNPCFPNTYFRVLSGLEFDLSRVIHPAAKIKKRRNNSKLIFRGPFLL